jgi:broad-specificity NMP kinase
VITSVIGAPGSGKSMVIQPLADRLRGWVVLDWDALMDPAAALAGRGIGEHPETWPAYRQLVRAVLDALTAVPVVLLGVCTPDELPGWPIDAWILLDCADAERERRILARADGTSVSEAKADAVEYRSLGLPAIDTAGRTPEDVADDLAELVQSMQAGQCRGPASC